MVSPQNLQPQIKRNRHVWQIISLIVLAALTGPLLIYGLIIAAFMLIPGGLD